MFISFVTDLYMYNNIFFHDEHNLNHTVLFKIPSFSYCLPVNIIVNKSSTCLIRKLFSAMMTGSLPDS